MQSAPSGAKAICARTVRGVILGRLRIRTDPFQASPLIPRVRTAAPTTDVAVITCRDSANLPYMHTY